MEAIEILGFVIVYTLIILLTIKKINGNKSKCIVDLDVSIWDIVEVGMDKCRMVYKYTYEGTDYKVEGFKTVKKGEYKKGDTIAIRINPTKPDIIYDKPDKNTSTDVVKFLLITSIVVVWMLGIIFVLRTLIP